jgi:hypothetical protein
VHCDAQGVAQAEQTQLLSALYRLWAIVPAVIWHIDSQAGVVQPFRQLIRLTQRVSAAQAACCEPQVPLGS